MLAKPAQDVLNIMAIGDVSEPVMLLQGVSIFRLEDIAKSDQCVFLLAATHSPFIFENKLAQFADVLTTEFLEGDGEQTE